MIRRILRIPIIPLGIVNAYLIQYDHGCILVDSGTPNSKAKIARVLERNKLSFQDIKLIIISHAHNDHAGSAADVRELSQAPILAHSLDMDFYRRLKPMGFCPTGLFGRLFLKTAVPHEPYKSFEPDIVMQEGEETIDLARFGFQGTVKHTGGHTAGHIIVELNNGNAFVGDLIVSGILLGGIMFKNRAIRPPFEDDPKRVADELESLVHQGIKKYHLGHGGPLEAKVVLKHANQLLKSLRQLPGNTSRNELLGP